MNPRIFLPALTLLATAVGAHELPAALDPPMENAELAIADLAAAELDTSVAGSEAREVFDFWRAAGPALWFAKDADFDSRFRERFLADHEAAARGELERWMATPEGALALVVLLDQFPRNAFRGTARMYDTDALARRAAGKAFAAGYDQRLPQELRKFFGLPFAHSEQLADQERSVALARRMGPDDLAHAEHHLDIVQRFGRFPHRNRILGRESTPQEQQYLDNGGFQG